MASESGELFRRQWRRVRSRALPLVVASQIAAVLCIGIDLAVAAGGVSLVAVIRGAVVALGLGLLAGLLFGLGLACALLRVEKSPGLRTTLPIAVVSVVAFELWAEFLQPIAPAYKHRGLTGMLILAIFIVLVVGAAPVALALRRGLGALLVRFPSIDRLAAPAPLAAVAAWLLFRSPGSSGARHILLLGFLSLSWMSWLLTRRLIAALPSNRRRVLWWAAAPALALALTPVGDDRQLQRGVAIPTATAGLAPLLDWDRDGFLAFFGDGDCDELNGDVSPLGIEIAGNGRDEDCAFGDLLELPKPAVSGDSTDSVVLLTVAGVPLTAKGHAELPRLTAKLAAGLRFEDSYGLSGRFRHLGGLLLSGRVPLSLSPDSGGFDTGSDSLGVMLRDKGVRMSLAMPKQTKVATMSTVVKKSGLMVAGNATKTADKAIAKISAGGFQWIHFDATKTKHRRAVDIAIARVFAALEARGSFRVLVVALSADRPREPPKQQIGQRGEGGPLAIIGSGIEARADGSPASMFDVFPTLAEMTGAELDAPVVGRSLLGPREGPVLTGWIGERAVVIASRDDEQGKRLVENGFYGPRRKARNIAARAASQPMPPSASTTDAVIGYSLDVLGCSVRDLPNKLAEVTVYLRGGETLSPADVIQVRLKGINGQTVVAIEQPAFGAKPFGTWSVGETVAHTVVLDRRVITPKASFVWVSVLREGKRLPVTTGQGPSRNWAWVCAVEAPP